MISVKKSLDLSLTIFLICCIDTATSKRRKGAHHDHEEEKKSKSKKKVTVSQMYAEVHNPQYEEIQLYFL